MHHHTHTHLSQENFFRRSLLLCSDQSKLSLVAISLGNCEGGDGFPGFFFLSCKEIVSRGCVVFSQTWMSSNNLLSLYPPLADILSLPYIRPVLS